MGEGDGDDPTTQVVHQSYRRFVDGVLTSASRRVVIEDRGTGAGEPLAALLRFGVVEPDASDHDDEVRVRLAPMDHPDGVLVDAPWHPEPRACRRWMVADWVIRGLTRRHLDQSGADIALHAGAVVDRDDRAAVVLGASGAGKSTMISHLVSRGLALVSDEQIGFGRRAGAIVGCPRPISIKAGGQAALPTGVSLPPEVERAQPGDAWFLTAGALGGGQRTWGHPVTVVGLDRSSELATPTLEELAMVEAFRLVAENSLDVVRSPLTAVCGAATLVASARTFRLRYGAAVDGAALVADLLATVDPPDIRPWAVTQVPDRGPGVGRGWRQSPLVIEVVLDGRLLLFHARSRALVGVDDVAARTWRELAVGSFDGASADRFGDLFIHGFVEPW